MREELLKAGFIETDDVLFKFRKELIAWDEVEDNDLAFEDIPSLLYGTSGINNGFCVYTGEHFIFINAKTPQEAVEWAEKIVAFERV